MDYESKQSEVRKRLQEEGIDPAEPGDVEYRRATAGGCRICNTGNGHINADMPLDMEFDVYYHPECLEKIGVDSITEFVKEWI